VAIQTLWEKLYAEEIASISMLGVEGELTWQIAEEALRIEVPESIPFDHACVFKVQRKRPVGA
jgi:hypothetical protein